MVGFEESPEGGSMDPRAARGGKSAAGENSGSPLVPRPGQKFR